MTEKTDAKPTAPGLYDRRQAGGASGVEIVAAIFSGLWMLLAGVFFLLGGGSEQGGLRFVLAVVVIVFPIMLIWAASVMMRTAAETRAESARLQAAVDALRQAYVAQAQQGKSELPNPMLLKRLDDVAARQKNIETTLAMLGGARAAAPAQPPAQPSEAGDDQPVLSLGTPAEALEPPLSTDDFIRALHFPETAEDQEGFAALRRALRDRSASQLVQAAQDVLTLLSQDGIYMDDLRPDLARPELWRAFARGERGRAVAGLGGIHDRSSLALAAGRMKQDPIFRDAAHHFLRRFDRSFAEFERHASDAEISEFGMTRTARAFMLLGRVAGTFD